MLQKTWIIMTIYDQEILSDEHAAACAEDSRTDSGTVIGKSNIDGIDNVRSRFRHGIFSADNLGSQ